MRLKQLGLLPLSLALSLALLANPLAALAGTYLSPPITRTQAKGMLTRFYYQAAMQVASQGGIRLSSDLLEKVHQLNPDSIEVAMLYGEFIRLQGDFNQTFETYRNMLQHFSEPRDQALIHYRMSLAYDDSGDTQSAIQNLEKAIALYSDKSPASFYYDLGVLYAKQESYAQTKDYSFKALQQAPEFAAAWNNYGYSLAKLGNYQQGYTAVKKALELEPENPNALDSMGFILFNLGRFKESIIEYEKAVGLDPKMAESYLFLGHSYEAEKNWEKALQAYERYMELEKSDEARKPVELKLAEIRLKVIQEGKSTRTIQTIQLLDRQKNILPASELNTFENETVE